MGKYISFVLLILQLQLTVIAQVDSLNPHNLPLTNTVEKYLSECAKNEINCLVDLEEAIPGIGMDIRYATQNNFTGHRVYSSARAFLRRSAADSLAVVVNALHSKGYGLKVFDAYRPYAATLLFWNLIGDTRYVASPETGSRHNRGCAVDVSLIDLATGLEPEMPTPFDDFSENAAPQYPDLPQAALANRQLLLEAMQSHGFTVYPSEWWHFDFKGWEDFSLLNLPFEQIPPKL